MRLELYPEDLKLQHQNVAIHPTAVRFEHLSEQAQKAVIAVGEGTFVRGDRYNVVHPPAAAPDRFPLPLQMLKLQGEVAVIFVRKHLAVEVAQDAAAQVMHTFLTSAIATPEARQFYVELKTRNEGGEDA